ncbi:MAG: hypothetical protein E7375_01015 [Clostridiales bacterium]|nr:hypothetical protein [Clostridiales bacterium]
MQEIEAREQEFVTIVKRISPTFDYNHDLNEAEYHKSLRYIRKGYEGATELFHDQVFNMLYFYMIKKFLPTSATRTDFEDVISLSYQYGREWIQKLEENKFPKLTKDWAGSIAQNKPVDFHKFKRGLQAYVRENIHKEEAKHKEGNADLYHGQEDQNIEVVCEEPTIKK